MTNSKISRIYLKWKQKASCLEQGWDGQAGVLGVGDRVCILGIHLSPTQYLVSLIPECKPWESPLIIIEPKHKSLYSPVFYFHFPISVLAIDGL